MSKENEKSKSSKAEKKIPPKENRPKGKILTENFTRSEEENNDH